LMMMKAPLRHMHTTNNRIFGLIDRGIRGKSVFVSLLPR
jgi:hypothetical protein